MQLCAAQSIISEIYIPTSSELRQVGVENLLQGSNIDNWERLYITAHFEIDSLTAASCTFKVYVQKIEADGTLMHVPALDQMACYATIDGESMQVAKCHLAVPTAIKNSERRVALNISSTNSECTLPNPGNVHVLLEPFVSYYDCVDMNSYWDSSTEMCQSCIPLQSTQCEEGFYLKGCDVFHTDGVCEPCDDVVFDASTTRWEYGICAISCLDGYYLGVDEFNQRKCLLCTTNLRNTCSTGNKWQACSRSENEKCIPCVLSFRGEYKENEVFVQDADTECKTECVQGTFRDFLQRCVPCTDLETLRRESLLQRVPGVFYKFNNCISNGADSQDAIFVECGEPPENSSYVADAINFAEDCVYECFNGYRKLNGNCVICSVLYDIFGVELPPSAYTYQDDTCQYNCEGDYRNLPTSEKLIQFWQEYADAKNKTRNIGVISRTRMLLSTPVTPGPSSQTITSTTTPLPLPECTDDPLWSYPGEETNCQIFQQVGQYCSNEWLPNGLGKSMCEQCAYSCYGAIGCDFQCRYPTPPVQTTPSPELEYCQDDVNFRSGTFELTRNNGYVFGVGFIPPTTISYSDVSCADISPWSLIPANEKIFCSVKPEFFCSHCQLSCLISECDGMSPRNCQNRYAIHHIDPDASYETEFTEDFYMTMQGLMISNEMDQFAGDNMCNDDTSWRWNPPLLKSVEGEPISCTMLEYMPYLCPIVSGNSGSNESKQETGCQACRHSCHYHKVRACEKYWYQYQMQPCNYDETRDSDYCDSLSTTIKPLGCALKEYVSSEQKTQHQNVVRNLFRVYEQCLPATDNLIYRCVLLLWDDRMPWRDYKYSTASHKYEWNYGKTSSGWNFVCSTNNVQKGNSWTQASVHNMHYYPVADNEIDAGDFGQNEASVVCASITGEENRLASHSIKRYSIQHVHENAVNLFGMQQYATDIEYNFYKNDPGENIRPMRYKTLQCTGSEDSPQECQMQFSDQCPGQWVVFLECHKETTTSSTTELATSTPAPCQPFEEMPHEQIFSGILQDLHFPCSPLTFMDSVCSTEMECKNCPVSCLHNQNQQCSIFNTSWCPGYTTIPPKVLTTTPIPSTSSTAPITSSPVSVIPRVLLSNCKYNSLTDRMPCCDLQVTENVLLSHAFQTNTSVHDPGEFAPLTASVCADSIDQIDAIVICRSFGCNDRAMIQRKYAVGDEFMWMQDVSCFGFEDEYHECVTGKSQCHSKEVAQICCQNIDLIESNCCGVQPDAVLCNKGKGDLFRNYTLNSNNTHHMTEHDPPELASPNKFHKNEHCSELLYDSGCFQCPSTTSFVSSEYAVNFTYLNEAMLLFQILNVTDLISSIWPVEHILRFQPECHAGTFLNTSMLCEQCEAGTYSTPDKCLPCAPNYASQQKSAQCYFCPQFSRPLANQSGCLCDSGFYPSSSIYSPSMYCVECPEGTASADSAFEFECKPCDKGYSTNNLTAQVGCAACDVGKYSDVLGAAICKSCHDNSHSERGYENCLCVPGFYLNQTQPYACNKCQPGSYKNTTSNTNCTLCSPGTYQPESGQTSCLSCPENHFQSNFGSIKCETCESFFNYYEPTPAIAPTGSSTCFCTPGHYLSSSSRCVSCPPGKFKATIGNDECELCADGKYALGQNEVCFNCPYGCTSSRSYGHSMTACWKIADLRELCDEAPIPNWGFF